MPDVAVVLTGLLRSLLSPPVAQTFEQHVRLPLEQRVDIFVVVVDNKSTYASLRMQVKSAYPHLFSLILIPEHGHQRLSCAIRGTRVDWASADPRDPNASSRLRPIDRDQGRMVAHAARVLLQWHAIREGYSAVESAERRRGGQRYAWLLRTRTDVVHLEPFAARWLAAASRDHVFVAEGGMNAMGVAMCQNDRTPFAHRNSGAPSHRQALSDVPTLKPGCGRLLLVPAAPLPALLPADGALGESELPRRPGCHRANGVGRRRRRRRSCILSRRRGFRVRRSRLYLRGPRALGAGRLRTGRGADVRSKRAV